MNLQKRYMYVLAVADVNNPDALYPIEALHDLLLLQRK